MLLPLLRPFGAALAQQPAQPVRQLRLLWPRGDERPAVDPPPGAPSAAFEADQPTVWPHPVHRAFLLVPAAQVQPSPPSARPVGHHLPPAAGFRAPPACLGTLRPSPRGLLSPPSVPARDQGAAPVRPRSEGPPIPAASVGAPPSRSPEAHPRERWWPHGPLDGPPPAALRPGSAPRPRIQLPTVPRPAPEADVPSPPPRSATPLA